ncbi:TPA: hypothetical protein NIH89_000381 [Pseudomonas aeruginosa]|uniref:DUF7210 family protein n=1 Tax=Pseudomonas aeruginosa TaxID=287 RepID=UPI001C6002ED|nr:hypothetical protein [Pseudomonas aeruginosa]MBY9748967.1 hypothetical protein [Pseudomonas aeruginosa]MCA6862341.1 hypothetical protein [Pseudomonas aeruginosa]MCA6868725.1 hypothetical protein [Pseudomonas aeruginosa]MCA6881546.1 hypothetical protein [Pseudomonas aeruginosa]MCM8835116.1 hypothetical protein [Pseudomonas aeruginosa]
MQFKAIKPLYRGGRLVQPGEPFDTTPEDGERLVTNGEALDPRSRKAPAKSPKGSAQAEEK